MLEQLEVRLAEPVKNVVDLREQSVGTELRTPSLEDRVGGGKDTIVDNKVVGGQTVDELLILSVWSRHVEAAHINETLPLLREV